MVKMITLISLISNLLTIITCLFGLVLMRKFYDKFDRMASLINFLAAAQKTDHDISITSSGLSKIAEKGKIIGTIECSATFDGEKIVLSKECEKNLDKFLKDHISNSGSLKMPDYPPTIQINDDANPTL